MIRTYFLTIAEEWTNGTHFKYNMTHETVDTKDAPKVHLRHRWSDVRSR